MKSFAPRGLRPSMRSLLAVMALIAALLAIALPRYFSSVEESKELTLRQSLQIMRDAIDKFYTDNARYPETLADLVEKRYLRSVPIDPVTESTQTWVPVAPRDSFPDKGGVPVRGKVFDVRSGAKGKTRDGVEFASF